MRGAVAAAVIGGGAVCLGLVARAAADEPRVALAWNAPAACPDEATVRANVAGLLAGSSATVEGRAVVSRLGDGWQVVLTMNGGERRLEADSCHALAEATALIVAMAVDPARVAVNRSARDAGVASGTAPGEVPTLADSGTDAAQPSDAAPLPSTSTPTPTSPPTPTPTSPPSPTPTPPSEPTFAAAAAATLDVGTLPGPAFGPSVAFAWLPRPLRMDLAFAYFPPLPSNTTPVSLSGASVQFSLLSLDLRACYQARLGPFDLGPCAGIDGGLLQANPQSFNGKGATPASGSGPLFAVDAGLLGAWRLLPAFAIFARTDALFQTSRPQFQVDANTVYQPSAVTARGALGVEVRF